MVAFDVRRAERGDLAAIVALLDAARLPAAGLAECIDTCFVAVASETVVAAAGLEPHGDVALLRSVVVRGEERGTGAGRAVVDAAIDLGRAMRLRALYLFTMHAAGFFERFGFVARDHREWPEAMRSSGQWQAVDSWDEARGRIFAMALDPLR